MKVTLWQHSAVMMNVAVVVVTVAVDVVVLSLRQ